MERARAPSLSPRTAMLACVVCATCTERQLIDHPGEGLDDAGGSSWGAVETTVTGEDAPFDPTTPGADDPSGNFPDPAVSLCGALPPGIDPMPGLASAWAVVGDAPGSDGLGLPYPDDQVRLRFSDYAVACDATFDVVGACEDAWTFAVSLPLSQLEPGIYPLASLPSAHPEIRVWHSAEDVCSGEGIGGGGDGGDAEATGELEIFSVTDECVVGELRDLGDVFGELDVDRNGGFVAMRCESDCVPLPGNGCG